MSEDSKEIRSGESQQQYFNRRMKEDRDSNSTIQRRRTMSTDEKRLGAVEKMARDLKDGANKAGKDVSYTEAHKEAVRIAERTFGKADGK